MQGLSPLQSLESVRQVASEHGEEGEDDYDIYLFWPGLEASASPSQIVDGPSLYGVRRL